MKKIIRRNVIISLLLLTSGIFLFYWFAIRPAQIKHGCSWVTEYVGGSPARPAMSEEVVKEEGLLKDCSIPSGLSDFAMKRLFTPQMQKDCENENIRLISVYSKPRTAIPAKKHIRKSTPNEYTFCLHDKGL